MAFSDPGMVLRISSASARIHLRMREQDRKFTQQKFAAYCVCKQMQTIESIKKLTYLDNIVRI